MVKNFRRFFTFHVKAKNFRSFQTESQTIYSVEVANFHILPRKLAI